MVWRLIIISKSPHHQREPAAWDYMIDLISFRSGDNPKRTTKYQVIGIGPLIPHKMNVTCTKAFCPHALHAEFLSSSDRILFFPDHMPYCWRAVIDPNVILPARWEINQTVLLALCDMMGLTPVDCRSSQLSCDDTWYDSRRYLHPSQWRHNERLKSPASPLCSTVDSGADQRKHQSSASLAFVRGIHQWPVNSLHKMPTTRKMFPFDDIIMSMQRCTQQRN